MFFDNYESMFGFQPNGMYAAAYDAMIMNEIEEEERKRKSYDNDDDDDEEEDGDTWREFYSIFYR